MSVVTIQPFPDQKPGTSGLRKPTRVFEAPHYLAAFVQSVFDVSPPDGALVLGGDGRFFSEPAAQEILRIAAANGVRRAIVGRDGLLSTPAASHLIRKHGAWRGIILSASHNPGGPDGDFGVKVNGPNGAPAPEAFTDAVFARSRELSAYRILDGAARADLGKIGPQQLGPLTLDVVEPAEDYADLMERLFDFGRIAEFLRTPGGGMAFDAMHAVTGPYAEEIFVRRLGAPAVSILRGDPRPDFGGGHPDPNLANARELVELMYGASAPALGAACDGDGDRHMVMGAGFAVNPSDSLAILLANAQHVPGYRGRITGVARSMPTSRAVDAVAQTLGVPCYETPTGWKYFGALLDAGRITLCGEESAGAGSDHVREKDGVWAVLYWLNILAARRQSVREIVTDHWARFGRVAAQRLDWEGLPSDRAAEAMAALRRKLPEIAGGVICGRRIEAADDFAYADPVTGDRSEGHGVRILLSDGGRVVCRLSGTGTRGATLRVYLDQPAEATSLEAPAAEITRALEDVARALLSSVDPELLVQCDEPHRT